MLLACPALHITAGAYFTYLLIMFVTSLSMSGLFRFIGSIAATPVHAQVCWMLLRLPWHTFDTHALSLFNTYAPPQQQQWRASSTA